jgi:hypothetical protein
MGSTSNLGSVIVRPIRSDEAQRWAQYMQQYHYLGYGGIAGRALRYVATLEEQWVALLGWGSAAFKCGPRDQYIGWDADTRNKRLYLLANNVRFLVLPWARAKNLASKVLSVNLRRLAGDYRKIHGHPVVLAETFVDVARYRGSCYRAANWRYLGLTRGYGKSGGRWRYHGKPKAVYVYALCRDSREVLSGDFLPADYGAFVREGSMKALREFPIEGLMQQIRQLRDPRKPRGVRHPLEVVIGIAICAVLCGARGFRGIADWAGGLRVQDLQRFGSRREKPPSEPTIRRMMQAVDAQEVDAKLGAWILADKSLRDKALALDGKTLRGTRDGEQPGLHLLSAVLHKEGIIVAQQPVDEKTNEITQVQPLIERLDLGGAVVTADALLTQREFATHLVETKGADYVFTVKGNQPTLLQDLKDMEFKKKLPTIPPSTRRTAESSGEASG